MAKLEEAQSNLGQRDDDTCTANVANCLGDREDGQENVQPKVNTSHPDTEALHQKADKQGLTGDRDKRQEPGKGHLKRRQALAQAVQVQDLTCFEHAAVLWHAFPKSLSVAET